MLKVNFQDTTTGQQLAGWKYWVAATVLGGALSSFGAEFPQYTPSGLYEAYQASHECGDAV